MDSKSSNDKNYVCINCGNPVGELFKEYSPSVLKMSNCDHCHDIADKYIEYDPVIVMIDVVLLNRQAYRHIIHNTEFKNHWKLAIILLLVESYYNWSRVHETSLWKIQNLKHIHYDLFQGEKNFYIVFGKSAFEMLIVYCTMYGITYMSWRPRIKPKWFSHVALWKSFVLANFGIFALILHLIWETYTTFDPMAFVISYIFFSHIQALSVVCRYSRIVAAIAASAALMMKFVSRTLISFAA